jgi:hypothetical protein
MSSAARKSDAAAIELFIDGLSRASWLDVRKKEWPGFIYHFNDIRNIASALRHGRLYSRQECQRRGIPFVNVADQEVIQQSTWTHDHVRLYFRPHTPTQYHQEGIRPRSYRPHDAHCAVPVFLLFESRSLLTQEGIEFTDGNFGSSGHQRGATATFLEGIPFQKVYHDEAFNPSTASSITYHRHAEVISAKDLDLVHLKEIVCRTAPERETLLHLLGEEAGQWRSRIRLERAGERLFYRQWLYVYEVQLIRDFILVRLRVPSVSGPYEVRVGVWMPDGTLLKDKAAVVETLPSSFTIKLPASPEKVRFRLEVEGDLAFEGNLSTQAVY